MTLERVHTGDVVTCNVRGRLFIAKVTAKEPGALVVEPVTRGITYRRVTARQVLKRMRGDR